MTEPTVPNLSHPTSSIFIRLTGWVLILSIPFLLVMSSIRLVMTPLFLQIEYGLPGFPQDDFGFTTEDRLNYAPLAVSYLLNGDDIAFLGDLRFPDGRSMYNARELHHMRDVKTVTQFMYLAAVIVAFVALLVIWRMPRPGLRKSLMSGGIFTLALIAAIIVIAILNWDFFFTTFHTLFFASGTWRFEYSDTLIRLFPEQFWFDAALVIGGCTVLGAIIILLFAWRWPLSKGLTLPE